jgi:hypothetical protein
MGDLLTMAMNKIKYNLFQAAYDPNAEKMAKQDQQQGADADLKVTLCERCGFRGSEAQLGLGSYNTNEMKIRNLRDTDIKQEKVWKSKMTIKKLEEK